LIFLDVSVFPVRLQPASLSPESRHCVPSLLGQTEQA
jgi:hypothetical protein